MQIKQYIINFFTKGHERSIKAKKNVIFSLFLKGTSILISLIYVPLLLDYLDSERYGIWLTISSILMWFGFFDIGLGNGLRNKLTEAFALKNYKLAKKYVSTTYALLVIIFLCLLIIFLITNYFLDWQSILNTTIVKKSELSKLTNIVFSLFILRFIFQVIGKIFLADQRPALNNLFNPLSNLISLVIILILIKYTQEGSLVLLGIIISSSPVIVFISVSIIVFKKRYKIISPSLKFIDFNLRRNILGLGFRFFILQIASVVLFSTANIIITQLFSPEEVTRYNIAFKYFQIPIMLFTIINTPLWSAVTDAYAVGDIYWLKNSLRKMNLLSLFFSIGIVLMYFTSKFFLNLWIGNRIDFPNILLSGMALFAIISVFSQPYSAFINGFGKLALSNYLVLIPLLGMIPLSIILSKSFQSSAGVIFTICIINGIGLIFKPIQIHKIITNEDKGIWSK